MKLLALTVVLISGAGCSAGPEPCRLADYPDVGEACRDSMRIAARATTSLRPSQSEVDSRHALLSTARNADARLDAVHDHSVETLDAVSVETGNTDAKAAWTTGRITTGIADVDSLVQAAGGVAVSAEGAGFILRFATPVNVERVKSSLEAAGDFAVGPGPGDMDGGTITLVEPGSARFAYRWGDCLSGCIYEHDWTVRVNGDRASVVEEGGDELPPAWPY